MKARAPSVARGGALSPAPVPEAAAALVGAIAAVAAAAVAEPRDGGTGGAASLPFFFALAAAATAAGAVSGRFSRSAPRVLASLAAILVADGLAARLALALLPWQAELLARPRTIARDALLVAISAAGTLAVVAIEPPPLAFVFALAEVAAATVSLAILALRAAASREAAVGGAFPAGRVALATLRFAGVSAALAILLAALLPRRPGLADAEEGEIPADPAAAAAAEGRDPDARSGRRSRRGGPLASEASRLDPRRAIRLPDPETEAFSVRLVLDGRPLSTAPPDALFRERALDRVDAAGVWTHDESRLALVSDADDGRDDGFLALSRRDPGEGILEQTYQVFGTSDRYVVLWPPLALRAESALTDSSAVLVQPRRTPVTGRYAATSSARLRPPDGAIERALAPRETDARDVALPRLDPRAAALARALRSATDTAGAFCLRVESRVRSAAEYRLEERPRLPRDADPVGDLLFEKRGGHCETFAAAMALLLRSGGVPARIAVGYRGAEPAFEGDGTFTVLERSRHAWVEARLDTLGWVPFDPTPPRADGDPGAAPETPIPLESDAGLVRRAVAFWDEFDLEAQRAALAAIAARLVERPFATALALLGLALLAVARAFVVAALSRRRAWRAARVASREEMAIVQALSRLRAKLASDGISAGPAATPRELLGRAAHWPESARSAAAAIVAAHEAARYAGRDAAAFGLDAAVAALDSAAAR